jgi:hypothetical protein
MGKKREKVSIPLDLVFGFSTSNLPTQPESKTSKKDIHNNTKKEFVRGSGFKNDKRNVNSVEDFERKETSFKELNNNWRNSTNTGSSIQKNTGYVPPYLRKKTESKDSSESWR